MSMKIKFDTANNPEKPTLVLAHRNGRKLGEIIGDNIIVKGSMINPSEISFTIQKFINGKENFLWDKIVDFKLIWYKEVDLWFEIYVEINENNETIKNVSCTQLGQAELSQIKLYNININNDDDIARDDYLIPTVFYNVKHTEASLLNRILEKAEHYSIIHVDETLVDIQKTFTFDNISIYDALQQIAEEIGCLFVFNSNSNEDGKIQRTISVYDLESNCKMCGHRGEFTTICPECGASDINEGYGEDTTIFVTSDELANDIKFISDTDSIKNCFKLEAGDDLMTATVRNCNPNGTDYIWYISEDVKNDMSNELVAKIESYDNLYKTYQNDYIVNIDSSMLQQYNHLVNKYKIYNEDLQPISLPIKGYPSLMTAYYNTIDLSIFLKSVLMPDVTITDTSATEQVALLTSENLSPVSVTDVSNISLATANNVVLSIAKIIIDSRYSVKINESALNSQIWTGNFIVTNYSNEEDTAISSTISIEINDNYEYFIQQKIDKVIKDNNTEDFSIVGLFKMDYDLFCNQLKQYCLNSLNSFYDVCQACIDILIEQGVADYTTWADSEENLYDTLYTPYYQKLKAIESELKVRQSEIDLIIGVYDTNGNIVQNGIQTHLDTIKEEIQNNLDFQNYIGNELWLEFCTYRREDIYSNENYISDGLTNSELFEKALEFIKVANNEIYKSAELQHSITSSLKNLLVIEKFKSLVKFFETGNWIRVMVDDKVYKLRLLEYEIDFNNIDSLSVEFSDVLKTSSGEADQKSIISKTISISSSYEAVKKQASQGANSNSVLNNLINNGLDTTNIKIIGGASNQSQTWDNHGMLFREYDSINDSYSNEQIKIINSTISMTNDNWASAKAAFGKFYYHDYKTNELKIGFGINGEVITGKLLIGEGLGIYNKTGNLTFDDDGFVVTNGINTVIIDPNSRYSIFNIKNGDGNIFSFGDDGDLIIVGNITAKSLTLLDGTKIGSDNISGLSDVAISGSYNDLTDTPNLSIVATSGSYNDLTDTPTLSIVATSGSYNDLTDQPDLSGIETNRKSIEDILLKIEELNKAVFEDTESGDV